jgi:hypothetical protein
MTAGSGLFGFWVGLSGAASGGWIGSTSNGES